MYKKEWVGHDESNHFHLIYSHQCKKHIYIGDLVAATNLNFIHSQNIMTVITAALGMDQLDYSELKLKHIKYPLLENKRQNVSQVFDHFFDVIEKSIRNGNILVHCSSGISRSPALVISYLMKKQKWSFQHALSFVWLKRKQVVLNIGFQKQLKYYQNVLKVEYNSIRERRNYSYTSQKKYSPQYLENSARSRLSCLPSQLQTFQNHSFSRNFNRPNTIRQFRKINLLHLQNKRISKVLSSKQSAHKHRSFLQFTQREINNFQIIKVPLNERSIRKSKKFSLIIQKKY